jgi:succinate dehydrogenase / fumarate reductase, cytochrome b subunit
MGLKRNVSLQTALRYKGQGPFLTYILHRIGGVGMAIFVTIHIIATFLGEMDMSVGYLINFIYTNPYFQIFFLFCVLFHVINGMRITILDLFPKLILYHRQAIMIEWCIFIVVYGFAVVSIITTTMGRAG